MRTRPIKVLYVSNLPGFEGGAERSLFEIISNIDRSKIEPYFASIHERDLTREIKSLGVPFHRLYKFNKFFPIPFMISNMKLVSFIKKNHIDLIHNNQCIDTLYDLLPGKLTNTPIIIHNRDSKFYQLDKFLVNQATCNIAISSWQNKTFLNNRAVLINNGIPQNRIPSQECKPRIAENVQVGLIGRLSPIKGQDVFIKAARIVLQTRKNVHFLIIGDDESGAYTEYVQSLKQLVVDNHLEKDVEFYGYIENSGKILDKIDISVVPSVREPFGRVIIESMAYCKPVVATNAGGALDIITADTGILVPVNDVKAIADAIEFLVDNPVIRHRMGSAGRERVIKHFTLEKTLTKIYELYEQLLPS
jgi:glycosyltransferase involved in cell wall biosynthesis